MLQPRNKAIIICSGGIDIKELANYLYSSENVYVMYTNRYNNDTQFVSLMPDKLLVGDARSPQIYITDSVNRYEVRGLLKTEEHIELYIDNGSMEVSTEELLSCDIIKYKDTTSTYRSIVDILYLLGALA